MKQDAYLDTIKIPSIKEQEESWTKQKIADLAELLFATLTERRDVGFFKKRNVVSSPDPDACIEIAQKFIEAKEKFLKGE